MANNWRAIGKQLANNGKPVGKQLNGKSRFNIVSVDLILKPSSRREALRTQGTNTAINSDLLHSDTPLLPFQAFANCLPIAWRLFACCSPTTRDLASHNISRNAKRALHHVSREAAAVGRSERLPRNAKPPLSLPLTIVQQLFSNCSTIAQRPCTRPCFYCFLFSNSAFTFSLKDLSVRILRAVKTMIFAPSASLWCPISDLVAASISFVWSGTGVSVMERRG